MKVVLTIFLALSWSALSAQTQKRLTRIFQMSLTPALGTNGLHPGGYSNYFSFNLSSGYAAANYLLEVAVISNLNVNETRGLQIAGVANLTGANAFAGMQKKEIDKKIREGFEANLSGIQISGLTNVVVNNIFGGQLSSGINIGGGALQGVQVAGIGNMINKYAFGIQLAGLFNMSIASMDGLQLSALYNMTRNELFGLQIGMWNRAGIIHGINSYENRDPSGVQIGLVNKSSTMNGFQIGLINWGKHVQGTQIGLINLFRGGKTPQTRDGTAIGLVNIGSTGYFAVYANELFLTNVEVATGTAKNRRVTGETTTREILNGLIYGRNTGNGEQWAIGYGLKKMYLNRSAAPGMAHFRFLAVGTDILHYSQTSRLARNLSLIARPHAMAGSRLHPRNKTFFLFAALAYNFYWTDAEISVETVFEKRDPEEPTDLQHWPGVTVGILVR